MAVGVILSMAVWKQFNVQCDCLPGNDFTLFVPTDAAIAQYRDEILRPHDPAEEEHYQGLYRGVNAKYVSLFNHTSKHCLKWWI